MKKIIIPSFFLFIIFGLFEDIYAQTTLPHHTKEKYEKTKTFNPKKIAIIGMTDNLEARKAFESKMEERLISYHIDAYQSISISSVVFTKIEKAEEELNELIEIITKRGYDSFMITAVTGVEEKREDAEGYFGTYKVYHLETDIYMIRSKDMPLLWGMCLDIYDYQLVELKIEDYVNSIIMQMEYEGLLIKNNQREVFPLTTN
ncbi:hypothetical protein ATE84_2701 [Aquimarina sp. MAR_2010_214]|uniref:hypothetical protein n=1 Tax=Aquimarina sp. MAR_2010_214 TaxID=1250026 RepID=UPI000C709B70|nr:hypothetical protein [Aquimarina sp. MAR_2010_214]PKV50638.1 hypothetical protein ATE84_2701 [Aquimarina sp. MAR_2010_214]